MYVRQSTLQLPFLQRQMYSHFIILRKMNKYKPINVNEMFVLNIKSTDSELDLLKLSANVSVFRFFKHPRFSTINYNAVYNPEAKTRKI